jgi:cytochrome c2
LASPLAAFLATVLLFLAIACGSEPSPSATPSQATTAPIPTVTADPTLLASLTNVTSGEPSADIGADLVLAYGCLACHSTDGSALVGPTWQGLYGTEEALDDGSSVAIDDEYITESIQNPNQKVTAGFTAGLMPQTLGVKDEEIPHIIEYIKSLK